MTDKQIIDTLRLIQNRCAKHDVCDGCTFDLGDGYCELELLTGCLEGMPYNWALTKLERILYESNISD